MRIGAVVVACCWLSPFFHGANVSEYLQIFVDLCRKQGSKIRKSLATVAILYRSDIFYWYFRFWHNCCTIEQTFLFAHPITHVKLRIMWLMRINDKIWEYAGVYWIVLSFLVLDCQKPRKNIIHLWNDLKWSSLNYWIS